MTNETQIDALCEAKPMVERREYDGEISFAAIDWDSIRCIRDQAAHSAITVRVAATELEIPSSIGRDTQRRYVRFLQAIAPLIGTASGEIRCTNIDTDDPDNETLEFYSIEDGNLFRQLGRIQRDARQPVTDSP